MVLYMSEDEIMGKFRRADNKKDMLSILAQLNACEESEVNYPA